MKKVLEWLNVFFKWIGIGLLFLVIIAFVLMAINKFLPEGWKLSSEIFVGLSAIVLSLTWNLLPGLRVQFAGLPTAIKSIVNLVLMTLLAVVMFVFTCSGWNPIPGVVCTIEGAKALAILVFVAGVANQTTFTYTPQPADVKAAKAARTV